jgi:uncharacterized protein
MNNRYRENHTDTGDTARLHRIINVQEGGAEVRFVKTGLVNTGISVWATGYQLNAGHKMRITLTSSLFPRFNRNLNDCSPAEEAVRPVTAVQKIFYGSIKQSYIDLPVFDAGEN